MKDCKFGLHFTENFVVVTRMIQTGVNPDTGEPIFRTSDVCRDNLRLAINEIRSSLDRLLETENKNLKKPIVLTA